MLHFLKILFLSLALLMPAQTLCAPQSAKKIKREQQNTRKAIEKESRRLEQNKKEINRQIKQLSQLEKEIGAQSHEIDKLQEQINATNSSITTTHHQIDSLNLRLKELKTLYTNSIRRIQTLPTAGGPLAYVLAAPSFRDAMQRARYLRQFSSWRNKREKEILSSSNLLQQKHQSLTQMQESTSQNLAKLSSKQQSLKQKQTKTDNLIGKLKKESGTLQTSISRRQKQLANLDAELNRIIEADRRARQQKATQKDKNTKPAKSAGSTSSNDNTPPPTQKVVDPDSKLTGSFEANKGNLLFPVTSNYRVVRGFGKSNYSARVQTNHVGIDIQVPAGAVARAIFNGQVTNVSKLDGFNTIVVIRHGQYLSVYINLASASVKAGQNVKAGQTIGSVAADPNDSAHSILQFGLRKDRTELNPLNWVKN